MSEATELTADEVIIQISDVLVQSDSDFIEHIANQVLGRKVKYIEDDVFEYADTDDGE